MLDLFRYYLSPDHPEISPAIVNYKSNQNHKILSLFEWIHDKIEADYRAVEEDVLVVIRNKLMANDFVTSRDFPELMDDSFRKELMADDSIGAWVVYDFGQAL
ncbi:transcriptional regulator, partial [Streptococcus suis]